MTGRKARKELFYLRWSRFNYEGAPKKDQEWLYARIENLVSCSIPGPCALGLVVSTICQQAREPVLIQILSSELRTPVLLRGRVVGSVWDEIDRICENYLHMQWWISDRRLIVDVVPPPLPTQDFEQIAGRLMCERRAENLNGTRLSPAQYLEIAEQLKEFKPLDLLPKRYRKELGSWNQQQQRRGIFTFSEGLQAKNPKWLHRQTMRILYRAAERFKQSG